MKRNYFLNKINKKVILIIVFFLLFFSISYATDLSSTNFIIRDPVVGTGGGYETSTNFKSFSSLNTLLSGYNSSTSFIGKYGFLYFPFVTEAVLTAVANASTAELDWTASTAGQGWGVSGYNTGIATVSGGPYTYTSVGNVITYDYTELAPGEYCFVVQTLDDLGYLIQTSNEDCVTIEPVITFDIDTSVADGETSTPYSVEFGALSPSDTKSSGTTDNIKMIILEALTNAPNGIVITVRNTNGANGLVSTSVPADNIGSADGTMAAGTENYGVCVDDDGADLSGFTISTGFSGDACDADSETNVIEGLSTTAANIVETTGPVSAAHAEVIVNAAVSGITSAHTDYTDAITFIATATY